MSEAKSVALFKQEGSADKVYQVQLVEKDGGWVVNYQNGRRGSPLTAGGTKTVAPVDYGSALAIYEKLVKTKKKGGYTESEGGIAYQDLPDGKEHSGYRAQLLCDINQDDVESLLTDPAWVVQVKHDKERRLLIKDSTGVRGTNRDGVFVPISLDLATSVAALPHAAVVLDGEDFGSHFYAFDVLAVDGVSTANLTLDARLVILEKVLAESSSPMLRLSPTMRTEQEKRDLLQRCIDAEQEGIVFKLRSAPYEAGRNKTQFKLKLKAEATCQVMAHNAGKRSVSIGVLGPDTRDIVAVGNVTIPPNAAIPAVGSFIEVRYLYAYEGGSLFQPTFKMPRTDKESPDSATRLKYKSSIDILDEKPARERMKA